MIPVSHPYRFPFGRRALAVVLVATFCSALPAQNKPNKAERRELKFDAGTAAESKPRAEDPQARILLKLRDQLEVADDAEWNVIADQTLKDIQERKIGIRESLEEPVLL